MANKREARESYANFPAKCSVFVLFACMPKTYCIENDLIYLGAWLISHLSAQFHILSAHENTLQCSSLVWLLGLLFQDYILYLRY